jgi:hypothetical protein
MARMAAKPQNKTSRGGAGSPRPIELANNDISFDRDD